MTKSDSIIGNTGSGDYAVVAFGDAVVLVSGGGAVVDNIAVAIYGEEVYQVVPPLSGSFGCICCNQSNVLYSPLMLALSF